MDIGIKMMISSQLQKLIRMQHLLEEVDFSLFFPIMEMDLNKNLMMQFNKSIKNITLDSKIFLQTRKIDKSMQLHCKIFLKKLFYKEILRETMMMARLRTIKKITLRKHSRKQASFIIQCKLFVITKNQNINMILEKTACKSRCSAFSKMI